MNENLSLFNTDSSYMPLAEQMRPENLSGFIGQKEIISEGSLLKKMIDSDNLSSFILWGPPGVGKTTLAKIISKLTNTHWQSLSAVLSGIKEAKKIMDEAKNNLEITGKKTILFVDEIHRFNKAQQDAFLPYVEKGTIILIGATTENPSFSIIAPLLSRMRVLVLKSLSEEEIVSLIDKAIAFLEKSQNLSIDIDADNKNQIASIASGDARRAYGILEMSLCIAKKNDEEKLVITKEVLEKALQGRLPAYDKSGENHYDHISALHKSMRNSDVDAAIYYTVKMLESGEDPLYIIRRVIEFSSEDIGMADPNALTLNIAARNAILALGMPEAKYAILQAVVYNTLAPKSNALYRAYSNAKKDIEKYPDISIPMQIRNAPTKLMKDLNYGKGYEYAHDYATPIRPMQCLPDKLKDCKYYEPTNFGFEKTLTERIEKIDKIKKDGSK